jgi:cation/acetate symporter
VLGIAEQMGLSRAMIGYVFLGATVLLYAGIGVMSRTNDAAEYYVAGHLCLETRITTIKNGISCLKAITSQWVI